MGGAVFVIPAIPAPIAYLSRVGPKPLSFNAQPLPLEEVMRMLPPLPTDLPPKPPVPSLFGPDNLLEDPMRLGPVPADPSATDTLSEFPRLPTGWIESVLGPARPSPTGSTDPADDTGNPSSGAGASGRRSIRPEDLVPFFTSPGPQGAPRIVVPVPFVPGVPQTPTSSRITFSQE